MCKIRQGVSVNRISKSIRAITNFSKRYQWYSRNNENASYA